jgi:hypothetical protein
MIDWDTLIKTDSDEENTAAYSNNEAENTEILAKSRAAPDLPDQKNRG